MIPDYIKYLQQFAPQEYDIEVKFPDALEQLVHQPAMRGMFNVAHNAEAIIELIRGQFVSPYTFTRPDGTTGEVLVASNKDGDELVWDAGNGVWWTEKDDKVEFDRVTGNYSSPTSKKSVEQTCPDCGGTGEWQGLFRMNKCSTCNGTGKVTT